MTNPDNVGGLRLFDSQWVNIVNHDNCYRDYTKEEAVAMAVKLTEQKMAENVELCRAAPAGPTYLHQWNEDGERCVKCGDKDWMGGPCSKPDAAPAGGETLGEHGKRALGRCIEELNHYAANPDDYGFDEMGVQALKTAIESMQLRLDSAPAGSGEVDDAEALREFTEYFVKNYPGPHTVIMDPNWHAPKIFRAAKRALLRKLQQGADGWRPIKTAPRDGTEVLISNIGRAIQVASYERDRGGWCYGWHPYDGPAVYGDATHWMPLPGFPASQDQEGGHAAVAVL